MLQPHFIIQPRLATLDDADAITDLVELAYSHYVARIGRKPVPMTVDYRAAVQQHQLWVLDAPKGIQAILELIPADVYLFIENIAVAPAFQKQGIGRGLLSFAEAEAIRQGYAEIRLLTNEHFVENLVLYQRIGYTEFHREAFKGSDTVHMKKKLL